MEVQTARSVIIKKYGGYESLMVENFPLPELEEFIEIKVDYGGLNFNDLYTRQGLTVERNLPFVLGMECSGTITDVHSELTEFKVGQKVICYDYKGGMYRDIIRVSPDKCYLLPEFIDSKIGAAIFVNYLTAYFALIEMGNLKENDKVLILSCAGGVGCAATQIAGMVKNVQIFGTGSSQKEREAKTNGVDVFYPTEEFKKKVEDNTFDVILSNEAGHLFTFLQTLLNPLGRIILIGGNNLVPSEHRISLFTFIKVWWSIKNISLESLIKNNRMVSGVHLGTLIEKDAEKVKKALQYIFELYKDDKISPKIDSAWPMSKIVEATKLLGERRNVGKVLIRMNEA